LTSSKQPIYVHSKMMIVDDRLLHVGSANLNNRSMGFDSECDLSIDAFSDGGAEKVQGAIRKLLVRLIARHLGRTEKDTASALARAGGLIGCIESLDSADGGRLLRVKPPHPSRLREALGERQFFDPHGRDDNLRPWRRPPLLRQ
jgi:phosphatidylserine/phosphatidylglycerophosphate/cardiolipin synthase-like enzyme